MNKCISMRFARVGIIAVIILLIVSIISLFSSEKSSKDIGITINSDSFESLQPISKKTAGHSAAANVTIKGEFEVGVLYWSMNIPGQVAMRKGLEGEAVKINNATSNSGRPRIKLIPYVAGDGILGIERQIRQMNELISKNTDMIIVQPTDIAALGESLQLANQSDIPVIAYDQHIIGGKLASFLTSDNYQAGYLNGEYVAANFPYQQKLRIILVEYPHVSSTVARVNGFIDALEDYKQSYQIINTYIAVEPIGGEKAGAAILQDYPLKGSIDVIFAVNDGGGLNVFNALEIAKRDEIFFASVDGDPASITNIRRKSIARIDSAQFCGELGAESMRTAYRLLLGEEVAEQIIIPVFPVTRETVSMFKGSSAPMPQSFKKPWVSNNPEWKNTYVVFEIENGSN